MTDDFKAVFEASRKRAEDAVVEELQAAEKKKRDYEALADALKAALLPLIEEAQNTLKNDVDLKFTDLTAYGHGRPANVPALSLQMKSLANSPKPHKLSSLYVVEHYGNDRVSVYEGATQRNPLNAKIDVKTLADIDKAGFGRLLHVMAEDYHNNRRLGR